MTLLIRLLLAQAHCKVFASKTPTQHRQTGYRRCTKTAFLLVGRLLCGHTFPALFKLHKAHSGHNRDCWASTSPHFVLHIVVAGHCTCICITCSGKVVPAGDHFVDAPIHTHTHTHSCYRHTQAHPHCTHMYTYVYTRLWLSTYILLQ